MAQEETEAGSPRLLVRVIDAQGTVINPIQIVTREIGVYSVEKGRPPSPYDLLVIQRESIAPDFKILLYPFREGDALPTTQWDGQQLSINFENGTTDVLNIEKNAQGYNEILLQRN